MTDEERRMFSNRLREAHAESMRLRAALTRIARYRTADHGEDALDDADVCGRIAKTALEHKP